jgi:hypothetical protein
LEHFKIFGCHVYIHVYKEKRTKLYWIYIPGQRQIEVRKYVTFEEEAFNISRGYHMEIDSERREEIFPSLPHPLTVQRETVEPIDPIDHVYPPALVDVPRDIVVGWKRPVWDC